MSLSEKYGNPLKTVSNVVLEEAIAHAIEELIGFRYICRIHKIEYEQFPMPGATEIILSLDAPFDLPEREE